MVRQHHWLIGYEFEQTSGDSKVQGSLVCCNPWWSQRVRHNLVTEQQQILIMGFPDGSVVKNPPANAGDTGDVGYIPASGRSPGGENGKSSPVFLPGESHEQSSLVGCSPWSCKESAITEQLSTMAQYSITYIYVHIYVCVHICVCVCVYI